MNRMQAAEQLRRALQIFSAGLTDEQAMEVATIFDPLAVGKAYAVGDFVSYGKNSIGDPQLYKVVQAHTAQAHWLPDETPALYTPIGQDEAGYPLWAKPAGAHDAYNIGDIVNSNGILYRSQIDGNVYPPDTHSMWWEPFSE